PSTPYQLVPIKQTRNQKSALTLITLVASVHRLQQFSAVSQNPVLQQYPVLVASAASDQLNEAPARMILVNLVLSLRVPKPTDQNVDASSVRHLSSTDYGIIRRKFNWL
ncbi:MAG: hypothetical protein Q9180_008618, partial [Flavoplaca navasiana]